ncbi:septum site-determining protein MinC [Bradyrhizobium genosp. L]|uniref:septum site-determining protein MinC n=1 Tax=Bradyrhizobium genosp. L TaxID=83637 RepID=UPI0018A309E3|nr:septum site-determining protein MinC [Bradyrhizobium genosp. L]QPF84724.1 septum site-determining protein MinC [Bradyrhizobium genosp. L]
MDATQQAARQQVRMRGRSYVAFVFSPVVPIVNWLAEIDATLAKSPGFFTGKPVVLDLAAVDLSQSAITHLVGSLGERDIRILGIEGVDEARLGANMPPLLTGGRACVIAQTEPKPSAVQAKTKSPSLLLEQPVRSGQSIVFAEGDVTVLGSVGSGAEIVAGGSIHIYGSLRGRAMAGINGNAAARIFCQKIEAELLAIDGYYQTAEDIDASLRNRAAQAWLEGEMLRITPLN